MIAYLLQGIGYGFAGAAQPGPFQAYIVSLALRNGWRRTLITALAPLLSDGPIILLVLLVLNQLSPALLRPLHLASGLFLGYLAWNAGRRWRNAGAVSNHVAHSSRHGFLGAVVMNLLSPGPYIFWSLVAGPTFLAGWRHSPAHGIGFIGGFYAALVGTFAATIIIFGTARQLGDRVVRLMLGLAVLALAGFALYQLWLGMTL